MNLEVRYARSFLRDLNKLDSTAYGRIYEFAFKEFIQIHHLQQLPGLQQLGSDSIFYRFTIDNYLIGIEVTGHIVKFLRVLPKPDIELGLKQ